MKNLNDDDLIRFSQLGDMNAFQTLVEKYQNRAIWIAEKILGNYEEARDISQEAFIRVYRALDTYKLGSNFYKWLYRIISNLCIDFLRKQKRQKKTINVEETDELQASDISVQEYFEKKELEEELQMVLQKIPDTYRMILVLRDLEGFSCKEIEEILDCNYNTVRWRLFRARQIFKDLWEKKQMKKNSNLNE
ncbi:MAG: RNA polymerase sigma factor [Planctomycetes bacterium]|nr:RNA polymerase sigma factor [Planctomycetota bacterium]HNZ65787.1 RNA polymerase sigma factor [Planctomycetota bacterium]HPY73836.1 RNA polymerase sigma factor [Planctomycetota bacterium]HQA99462.1 RNA polymerase sigma factor [Planctomycetota bacterium]HRU50609.1 RNA polymerase sigma factor [Planctomycetota bacterium]